MLSQDAPAGSVRFPSGPFSRVYALEGPKRDVVVKLGPPTSSLREAAALQDVRRLAIAPQVLAVGEGVIVLERMPGATVAPPSLGTRRAAILGAVVRRLHDSFVAASGGWPDWPDGARDLPEYHALVVDAVREWATAEHADLTGRVLAGLPAPPPADEPGFRRLHGDLWSGNVVWDGDHPSLVDWEYARRGDPAEELAYLIEMDAMAPEVQTALLDGYGHTGIAERVEAWRPLAALGAGLWYAELGLADRAQDLLSQAARLTSP
jgi:aminoglycoside phosphotransferase (APT) family kinase protein